MKLENILCNLWCFGFFSLSTDKSTVILFKSLWLEKSHLIVCLSLLTLQASVCVWSGEIVYEMQVIWLFYEFQIISSFLSSFPLSSKRKLCHNNSTLFLWFPGHVHTSRGLAVFRAELSSEIIMSRNMWETCTLTGKQSASTANTNLDLDPAAPLSIHSFRKSDFWLPEMSSLVLEHLLDLGIVSEGTALIFLLSFREKLCQHHCPQHTVTLVYHKVPF